MEVAPSSVEAADATAETLDALLAASAERDEAAAAILAPGRAPLTFGGLIDQVDQIRRWLHASGVGRRDHVAMIAPRGPEAAVAALGIASSAICVPLNPGATEAETNEILTRTRAKALVAPEATDAAAWDVASKLGLTLIEWSAAPGAAGGRIRLASERSVARAPGRPSAARATDVAFVICTSGTTARAKLVPTSHRNLAARADKIRRLLGVLPGDRCLNLMPLFYTPGLQAALIGPLAAGASVICPPAFDEQSFFVCLRELRPTWYTAAATYHQTISGWLRKRSGAAVGHSLRFARSAAAPLPTGVQDELERLLGIPVLDGYGASEAGLITVSPPRGVRKRGSVGISCDADVAVVDDRGTRLPPGIPGEVVVRGPTVTAGYVDDTAATAQAFREGGYWTGDEGVLDADGYLTLTGRIKEMINRGGEKISPREVEVALLEHPAVAEAVVFAVPHPTLHEEVAAAVTLEAGEHAAESHLRRFLFERVSRFKVPRRIIIAPELPTGATGKIKRQSLAEHFALHLDRERAAVDAAGCTPTERILISLWRDALERDDIGPDDDFFLLGGDSLSAVDLIGQIEEELQVSLPLQTLVELPTVRQLAERLQAPGVGGIQDVVAVNTNGRQLPLFSVCGIYGYALRLLLVGRELGADQPFYGLQPPGMDWGRAGVRTIPQMAAHYIDRLRTIQAHGPYRLLGVSFGGLVVFEMALQLQTAGEEIELLALLDTKPTTSRLGRLTVKALPGMREDDQPRVGATAIEDAGLRTWRAHIRARDAYVLEGSFRGELTYLYCSGERSFRRMDRRRLWRYFASGGVRWLPLPGPHGPFHLDPQFSAVCRSLRACLMGEAEASAAA